MYYDVADEMDEFEDEEESKYWLNVATAACHFYLGEYDKATGVEQLPASLEYSKLVKLYSFKIIFYLSVNLKISVFNDIFQ